MITRGYIMNIENNQSRITIIKARLYELSELNKEKTQLREELVLLIGELRGYESAKAEFEMKFDIPLSPEIEQKIQAIIKSYKEKEKEKEKEEIKK